MICYENKVTFCKEDRLTSLGYSTSFCSEFQARVGRLLSVPFLLASLNDLRFPATETQNNSLGVLRKIADIAMDRLSEKCTNNEYVFTRFLEVMHMKQGFIWNFFDPKFVYNLIV